MKDTYRFNNETFFEKDESFSLSKLLNNFHLQRGLLREVSATLEPNTDQRPSLLQFKEQQLIMEN